MRFNYLQGTYVRFSTQGGKFLQDFSIVQNNIFDSPIEDNGLPSVIQFDRNGTSDPTTKHVVSNNSFYNYDITTSANTRVNSTGFGGISIYNNIYTECKRPWNFNTGISPAEYIDYNHFQNDSIPAPQFDYLGDFGKTLAQVQTDLGFDVNSGTGNPVYNNQGAGNFTLASGSAALTGGIDGTQQGVYVAPFINIGAN